MSTDIPQAFAHPEVRAAATAPDSPRDRISLRDHIVEVEIGAFQAERGTTQRLSFNIVVEVAPVPGPIDDDVDRILSYDRVSEAIARELAAERLNLLETLAERIAARILMEPQARRVFVRIEKLDRGPGALGVEIVRMCDEASVPSLGAALDEAMPHPRLVFLSNPAIDSDRLSEVIDDLQADCVPLILCVGLPDFGAPRSQALAAQSRIDLLSIEQNAWVLAGRDLRFVVVATRTELDWSVKHGQIAVWAPSKLVLDSAEGPRADPSRPLELALWLAAQVNAAELVVIGTTPPKDAPIPVRHVTLPG